MALIKKIREKSGIAVGLVALTLGLFMVGGDIIGPNSTLLGQSNRNVGEIAGEKISIEEYQQQIEELRYNFTLNFQRNPTESEMYSIRQQAWELLIVNIAFQEQFDELGLTVTDREVVDMVQGNNIRPEIAESFRDPETGEIDRSQIKQYLNQISAMPQQQQAGWYLFEKNLRPSRLRIKYDNLMLKSNYVTTAEAKKQYNYENSVAEAQYLYVPYYSVNDTLISVTENELRKYLNEHKDEFQVEESRKVKYVRFPIQASGEDTTYLKKELTELMDSFRETEEDSVFATINSDGQTPYSQYNVATMPEPLRANISNLSEGDVRGPYLINNNYILYKISGITTDSVKSARASHILISSGPNDEAKSEARAEAQRILNELRGGADFEQMARENSDDPSASRGGDLGWFTEGRMVEPFENAVFGASSRGLINRVVETSYGFHIINVTEPATDRAFEIAAISRSVAPSETTRNEMYRRADRFASSVGNLGEFLKLAETESLPVDSASNIRPSDRRIGPLADARSIVMWLYNEAAVGEVSDVYELNDEYVVVALEGKTEKGVAQLSDVRDRVIEKVKNEKRAKIISEKLKGLEGSLDEIASAYGSDASVYSSSNIQLSNNTLPTVGVAPEVIGKLFAMEEGERTEPVALDNGGVVVAELQALTEAPEATDYVDYKDQVAQQRAGSISYNLSELIKDFSDIEDKRHRFY